MERPGAGAGEYEPASAYWESPFYPVPTHYGPAGGQSGEWCGVTAAWLLLRASSRGLTTLGVAAQEAAAFAVLPPPPF